MERDARLDIRFCPACGSAELDERVPKRDDRVRLVCARCGYVHYVGPALAAGAIVHEDGRFLLVRRAWDPGRGLWTFPGGFVDLDEDVRDAALREVYEETGVRAEAERLLGLYGSVGARGKRVVIAVYVARAGDRTPGGCEEVEEVRWFSREELPWNRFAFPSTAAALRDYLTEAGGGPRSGPPASG